TLKMNDKPGAEGAWDISVKPVPSETYLRYLEWVESRRKMVATATGGSVGYMHVPDTSISGIIMFDKYLNAQIGKDSIIVDERYNGGGRIPDFYTEKLQPPPAQPDRAAGRQGRAVAFGGHLRAEG